MISTAKARQYYHYFRQQYGLTAQRALYAAHKSISLGLDHAWRDWLGHELSCSTDAEFHALSINHLVKESA